MYTNQNKDISLNTKLCDIFKSNHYEKYFSKDTNNRLIINESNSRRLIVFIHAEFGHFCVKRMTNIAKEYFIAKM